MTSRLLFLLTALLIGGYPLSAASSPETPLKVNLDCAQFHYQEGGNYLELYYALGVDQLTYAAKDGQFEGALIIHVQITAGKDQQIVVNRRWHNPHQIEEPSETHPGEKIVGVIGLVIPDAVHVLKAWCTDMNDDTRIDSTTFELPYRGFKEGLLTLSDVEFCSSLRKGPEDPTNMFYKNTYEAIPLPSRIYDPGKPVLFYYAEAYNLLSGGKGGSYYLHSEVYDSEGQIVLSSKRSRPKAHASSVEVGKMNVHELFPGAYTFTLTIGDSAADITASSSKTFYVYHPGESLDRSRAIIGISLKDEYSRMGEVELDEESAFMLYIMSWSERRRYKKLPSVEAKRIFLYGFWERKNPAPQNPADEYRREYLHRMEYANQQVSVGPRKGWKTDRGRVIIIYGEPDNIDRFSYQIDQRPYEIWTYDAVQGGIHFIFIDKTGFSDYVLVHSTARDELHDSQWRSQLNPGR